MAIEKTLTTRILLRHDTYANWIANDPVLKKGEAAIATIPAQTGAVNQEPATIVKFGNGTSKFSELPILSGLAANVHNWALAADKPTYAASEITGIDAKIADYVSNEMGIEVDTDTQYNITKVNEYQYKLMSKPKGDSDYTTEVSVIDIPNDTAAIEALQGLVGESSVAEQIATYVTNLKLAETYDAQGAAAQALTDAKKYADDEDAKIESRVDALETKFGSGEGTVESQISAAVAAETSARETAVAAVQAEVDALEITHANDKSALEASIKTADDKAVAAQKDVDSLEAKVGDVTEGKTVVQMIADAQTAATYDDTKVKADITALEGLVGDTAVATQISTAVKEEADRAKGVESGLETRLAAVEGDYLKAADKTELEDKITTNANAIERLTNGVSAEEVDGVNDLIQYVKDHGTEVTGMKNNIKANADAIDAIEKDYLKAADKTELAGDITRLENRMDDAENDISTKAAQVDHEALAGRVTTVEGKVSTLETKMDAAENKITALEGKVGDTSVSAQITTAIANENLSQYAKATDLTTANGKIATLEGKAHEHANKTELDKFANGDKAKLDAAVQTVTAGTGLTATKTGTDVAINIDESVVFIFDCGDSTTV